MAVVSRELWFGKPDKKTSTEKYLNPNKKDKQMAIQDDHWFGNTLVSEALAKNLEEQERFDELLDSIEKERRERNKEFHKETDVGEVEQKGDSFVYVVNKDDWEELTAKEKAEEQSVLQKQHGGNHYKVLPIQPWEYIEANKLDFWEGNVIKYITRYKNKNGIEDLEKAQHYIEYLIEREKAKG